MNILPSILYPLQMFPLRQCNCVPTDINKALSNFSWHGKTPRLGLRTLRLPKDKGSLWFPNFKFYNWACYMRVIRVAEELHQLQTENAQ